VVDAIRQNEKIKDNMRVDDYIHRLTEGIEVVACSAKIMMDASRLRGEKVLGYADSLTAATARDQYATLITENDTLLKCPSLKSMSCWRSDKIVGSISEPVSTESTQV
jgi:predicted nucleic acid-binding protein